jgi:hypothetical protein
MAQFQNGFRGGNAFRLSLKAAKISVDFLGVFQLFLPRYKSGK